MSDSTKLVPESSPPDPGATPALGIDPAWDVVLKAVAVPVTIVDLDGRELYSNGVAYPPKASGRAVDRTIDETVVVRTTLPAGVPERSAPEPSGIDADRLQGLASELGSCEFVADILQTFLHQLDDRVTAIESDDPWERLHAADALRSASLLVGAHRLAHACGDVVDGRGTGTVREMAVEAAVGLRRWRVQQMALRE